MLARGSGGLATRGVLLAIGLALPAGAIAQVEEIKVTARKREENLQEVPISVTVLNAQDIQRKNINSLADLTRYTASLEFDEGFAQSDTRAIIRGLSALTGRQNAALLVDGIDVSTESISSGGGSLLLVNRMVDVARVEVAKGPQMVEYGRSAFNGAIQYVTKDPADELELEFGLDGNDESQYSGRAAISGPLLGDQLGARLAGSWWDEEGFYDNSITGGSLGDEEGYGLALTLLYRPAETLSLKLRTEYQHAEGRPSPVAFLPFNADLEAPQAALDSGVLACFPAIVEKTRTPAVDARTARVYDPGFTDIRSDDGPFCQATLPFVKDEIPTPTESQVRLATNPFNPGQDFEGYDRDITRLSLVAEWELPKGVLTSWTGYTYDDTFEAQDAGEFAFPGPDPYLDGNVSLFLFEQAKETRQFSQELRYATQFEGPVNISLGGLLWQEHVNNDANSLTVQASGSHCAWSSATGLTFDDFGFTTDGSGCPGYTEIAAQPLVGGNITFGNGRPYRGIDRYRNPSHTDRDTEHYSIYGMVDLALNRAWTLTLEGRLNHETVDQYGPIFLNPAASGGASNWSPCGIFFRPCTSEFLFHAPGTYPTPVGGAPDPGGPFWSKANFLAAYEQWDPFAPVSSTDPRLRKDAIPPECLSDPNVQARLENIEQGGEDPFDLFNPWCMGKLSRDDDWFSPKVTVDWRVTDDALLYAYWARAEKPGGFATGTIGSNGLKREISEFEPEVMDVYELGLHSTWLDQTLIVNGAVFFQDYTDKQTIISALGNDGRPVSKIDNAAAAEVWGAELETRWEPGRKFLGGQWSATAGYTWLDSEYVDAEFTAVAETTITVGGNCTPVSIGVPACVVSYTGNSLEGAPDGKFVGTLRYVTPVTSAFELFAEWDFRWTGKRYVEPANRSYVGAYSVSDFYLGLQGQRWEVVGYVTNVFDDDSPRTAFSGRPALGCCFVLGSGIDVAGAQPTADRVVMVDLGFTSTAILPPPRVVGLQLGYRFGGEERR